MARLRKPKRLRSEQEVQLAKDVIDSYGGSGVAAFLYYHRTGEVPREIAALSTGSPAQLLLEDLRYV